MTTLQPRDGDRAVETCPESDQPRSLRDPRPGRATWVEVEEQILRFIDDRTLRLSHAGPRSRFDLFGSACTPSSRLFSLMNGSTAGTMGYDDSLFHNKKEASCTGEQTYYPKIAEAPFPENPFFLNDLVGSGRHAASHIGCAGCMSQS